MADFDVVIVGTGHNALVCGAYLAQAGYRICLLERRPIVGGATATEEIVPGFRFDLGGSTISLLNLTPIVEELALVKYGYKVIDLDPLVFTPFPDGSHLMMWKDVARTCDSIAAISLPDAERYVAFVRQWQPFTQALVESVLQPPSPLNVARYLLWEGSIRSGIPLLNLRLLAQSYSQVLRRTFISTKVQAMIGCLAAQAGSAPTSPGTGSLAVWHTTYHLTGLAHPVGGAGLLSESLARMIEAHGGRILTETTARRIVVEGNRAVAVESEDGSVLTAHKIVSGAHILTTLSLLGEAAPQAMRKALAQVHLGNGSGTAVRFAMHALPEYTTMPGLPGAAHRAIQFICPDLDYLERAYQDYGAGRPSSQPALTAMTFSAVDPSMAPSGKHILYLWGLYSPYELADGQSWDALGPRVADQMLDTLAAYAPNVREAVIARLVETPRYLENTLGHLRGNITHLNMSPSQMYFMRPARLLGKYRTPISNLYLTGASTHPGGGIMGASGRNAAAVILKDLSHPT